MSNEKLMVIEVMAIFFICQNERLPFLALVTQLTDCLKQLILIAYSYCVLHFRYFSNKNANSIKVH